MNFRQKNNDATLEDDTHDPSLKLASRESSDGRVELASIVGRSVAYLAVIGQQFLSRCRKL